MLALAGTVALAAAAATAASSQQGAVTTTAKTLPNFVMVLTDDLGWNTAWHNPDVISPTLDAMVKESIEMRRHCEPSESRQSCTSLLCPCPSP